MTTVLDVVIPVYNEEATIAACVQRLHDHLVATYPYPFRITVADNASTDSTLAIAEHLAARIPDVQVVHLQQKGRGRALRQVWFDSDALILAYLDVDLSTDLDALYPLVAPLMSGHSDLAIGSRLHHSSRVIRGTKREVISRAYNLILRATLGARFSDAQCGFKAIRADVARELLPLVEDNAWFFDTELLVLAQRCGMRIHEVPVDWCDDPDSRVDVVSTARDDLRGVWRMRRAFWLHILPTTDIAARMGRGRPERRESRRVLTFAAIGLSTSVVQLGMFAGLRIALGSAQVANGIALAVATIVNTWANGRFTFGVRERAGALRQQAQGFLVFFLTLGMTSVGLGLLHATTARPSAWLETFTVAVATVTSTATKYVLLKRWVFRPTDALPDNRTSAPALVPAATSESPCDPTSARELEFAPNPARVGVLFPH